MGKFISLFVSLKESGIIRVFGAFLETGNPCDGHETFREARFVWTTLSGCGIRIRSSGGRARYRLAGKFDYETAKGSTTLL